MGGCQCWACSAVVTACARHCTTAWCVHHTQNKMNFRRIKQLQNAWKSRVTYAWRGIAPSASMMRTIPRDIIYDCIKSCFFYFQLPQECLWSNCKVTGCIYGFWKFRWYIHLELTSTLHKKCVTPFPSPFCCWCALRAMTACPSVCSWLSVFVCPSCAPLRIAVQFGNVNTLPILFSSGILSSDTFPGDLFGRQDASNHRYLVFWGGRTRGFFQAQIEQLPKETRSGMEKVFNQQLSRLGLTSLTVTLPQAQRWRGEEMGYSRVDVNKLLLNDDGRPILSIPPPSGASFSIFTSLECLQLLIG